MAVLRRLKKMELLKMEEKELEYFKNILTAWLEELRHSSAFLP